MQILDQENLTGPARVDTGSVSALVLQFIGVHRQLPIERGSEGSLPADQVRSDQAAVELLHSGRESATTYGQPLPRLPVGHSVIGMSTGLRKCTTPTTLAAGSTTSSEHSSEDTRAAGDHHRRQVYRGSTVTPEVP